MKSREREGEKRRERGGEADGIREWKWKTSQAEAGRPNCCIRKRFKKRKDKQNLTVVHTHTHTHILPFTNDTYICLYNTLHSTALNSDKESSELTMLDIILSLPSPPFRVCVSSGLKGR